MNKPSPDDPPLRAQQACPIGMHRRNHHSLFRLRTSDFGLFLLLLPLVTSCVSKSKADARARAAFIAGQQQAMMQMQQNRGGGPSITIIGAVRNSVLPCSAGLTLARALVAADYFGPDPTQIVLVRSGRAIVFDPKKLLNGEDVPLQPGDMVEIRTNPAGPNPESPGALSPVPK